MYLFFSLVSLIFSSKILVHTKNHFFNLFFFFFRDYIVSGSQDGILAIWSISDDSGECIVQKQLFGRIEVVIGKKHALKKYDQFALNTSCFWGSSGSNITPVVQFHEIFVTKILNKLIFLLSLKQKISWNCTSLK